MIGIQSGPRNKGSTLASMILGGRGWDAGCGDEPAALLEAHAQKTRRRVNVCTLLTRDEARRIAANIAQAAGADTPVAYLSPGAQKM